MDVVEYLFQKIDNSKIEKFLEHSLIDLKYHPLLPDNNINISFRKGDVSYFLFYSNYKIEISDYVTNRSEYGSDHYQRYKFLYTPKECRETEGVFDIFVEEFWFVLQNIPITNISIGTEE